MVWWPGGMCHDGQWGCRGGEDWYVTASLHCILNFLDTSEHCFALREYKRGLGKDTDNGAASFE
jgi:hypothetical protein